MNEALVLAQSLTLLTGLKKQERLRLFTHIGSTAQLCSLKGSDIEALLGRPLQSFQWNAEQLVDTAHKQLEHFIKRSINAVPYGDAAYPPLLNELADPPLILYYRGVLPDPEQPMVAVVGTRNPTGAGRTQAYQFGFELGAKGIPVVSGLARGIDSMAHRGNLEGGGKTVAILGNGLDSVYPVSNRSLALRILQTGGCLISEYPPGVPPYKWHFPERNRIIAGLARDTIVVEAPEHSGSLITAQFALDQGREVWIGSVCRTSPHGQGGRALAEDGALYIDSVQALFHEWNQVMNVTVQEE